MNIFAASKRKKQAEMPQSGMQVRNGKAFEYALATQYVEYLQQEQVRTILVRNTALENAKKYYESQSEEEQKRFDQAARQTIDTLVRLEPGLLAAKDEKEELKVFLAADAEGAEGDVRDVIFRREESAWEVGFSAKNNNEAVKHSRLSHQADFGTTWLGIKCSQAYWDEVLPIFQRLQELSQQKVAWNEIIDKNATVYLPILMAFRKELLRIDAENKNVPQRLIKYLIGRHPFYKIIKDDDHNLVVVKAFNLDGLLNKKVNGVSPHYKTPRLNYPTRIVEFELKRGTDTTLNMILDEGWEISFRIHNASSKVESSLKFDIKLLGNPPILFTQHLFQ